MKKNIPLTIEHITDADEKECRITSTNQIVAILSDIAASGTSAALYYNTKREFIMTTILDVDDDGMWVEQGRGATENHHITESRKLTLVSSHNQVKVQFVVNAASPASYDDQPAFFLPLPASLYRFQRRDFFRLSLPPSEYLRCTLNITKPKDDNAESDATPLEMSVIDLEVPGADISGGGIGLICMEGEFDFQPGETYTGCQIEAPEIGHIQVTIIVRNIIPLFTNKFGKTCKRVGCEFVDVDGPTAGKLQRFITGKQRTMAASGLM